MAVFGAIVLGGIVAPGVNPENLAAIRGGGDLAGAFHRLFLAMAERPLRSGKTPAGNGTTLE